MQDEPCTVIGEVAGLYKVVVLNVLRRTQGVHFDTVPLAAIGRLDAIDRLVHAPGARSPVVRSSSFEARQLRPARERLERHGHSDDRG